MPLAASDSAAAAALAIELDRPTRRGLDSDEPAAAGEVARDGAAVDSIDCLDRVLARVALDRDTPRLVAGPAAPLVGAMYLALAAERELPLSRLRGVIEYSGGLFPARSSARLLGDLISYRETAAPALRVAQAPAEEGPAMNIVHRTPAELEQQARLVALRRVRDGAAVSDALERVEVAAKGGDNLIPYLVDAARARATLGELAAALRRVFGDARSSTANAEPGGI